MSETNRRDHLHENEFLRLMILIETYKKRGSEMPLSFLIASLKTALGRPRTDQEIESEIQFLVDKNYLVWRWRELGATKLYRITSAGVELLEREFPAHVRELD